MPRFTFTTFCLTGFAIGIWFGTPHPQDLTLLRWSSLSLVTIGYLCKFWRSNVGCCFGILFSVVSGFSHVTTFRSHIYHLPETVPVSGEGVVVRQPDNRDGESRLTIATTHQGKPVRFLAHVPPYPRFKYGELVTLSGSAHAVEPIENFDYPLFLERQGITHTIKRATVTSRGSGNQTLLGTLYVLRAHLEQRAERNLPEPEASLLNGILLGSRQNLSEDLTEVLRATGTSHIVAISGANITIVVGMLVKLLPLSSLPAQRNATIGIGLLLSLMTGASSSVVRGSVVAGVAAAVRAAGRPLNVTSLILLPAACMLVSNPLYLKADPSFQLSLSAYMGIVLLSQPLEKMLALPLKVTPSFFRGSILETVAASAGTLPVSLTTFGSVSWMGLLANPAVLWLLPFITAAGGIFLILPVEGVSDVLWLLLHTFLRIIYLANSLLHA